jgi:uncharacterized protein (TIGR01777 family)
VKVAVTGATGLIGSRVVQKLLARGDEVVVLSRDVDRARSRLGGVSAAAWDPLAGPAPADALSGVDGVVHLAGEPIAQRWSDAVKERIRASRVEGTSNLAAGLAAASEGPAVLVSAAASGFYGSRGDVVLDESAPPGPGDDFLASLCVDWEQAADAASSLGIRVVRVRTGVVLDRSGGALAKMLPPFRLGIGGPVAGGRQYMSWIHLDDVVGIYLAALSGSGSGGPGSGGPGSGGPGSEGPGSGGSGSVSSAAGWNGPVNACAPEAVTNAAFSRALGRALHRPAVMPVPEFAIRLLYGEMATVVTGSQRMVPARALELGYRFEHEDLDEALRAALS